MDGTHDTYILGRTDREARRLILQHQIYGPITRRFLSAAGIGRGMKVLDVGSGAGDVTLLLADMVGPRGRVVSVDTNPAIVEMARGRAEAAGWNNIEFRTGDMRGVDLETDFDAVVGRWILMYLPDPVAVLRYLAARLRAGGIVAFHENDFTYPPAVFPPSELSSQVQRWTVPPLGTPGPELQMGTKLFSTFIEADLPAPELAVEAPVGGGPDWAGYEYVAETLRSLLPMLTRLTGLDPREVGIDTLAQRLRDDVVGRDAIQVLPIMFGAWARKTVAPEKCVRFDIERAAEARR